MRILVSLALVAACASSRPDGVEVARLPDDLRDDYALFASRCSRCHTLARPLAAHVSDQHWIDYIARMRRMPGSGITPAEGDRILHVLFYLNAHRGDS